MASAALPGLLGGVLCEVGRTLAEVLRSGSRITPRQGLCCSYLCEAVEALRKRQTEPHAITCCIPRNLAVEGQLLLSIGLVLFRNRNRLHSFCSIEMGSCSCPARNMRETKIRVVPMTASSQCCFAGSLLEARTCFSCKSFLGICTMQTALSSSGKCISGCGEAWRLHRSLACLRGRCLLDYSCLTI